MPDRGQVRVINNQLAAVHPPSPIGYALHDVEAHGILRQIEALDKR